MLLMVAAKVRAPLKEVGVTQQSSAELRGIGF